MALIGLENVHYAKLKKDDSTGVKYETPKKLSGAISIKESSESNTKTNNPEYTTQTLSATFMPRQYDGNYKYVMDSKAASIASSWDASVEG